MEVDLIEQLKRVCKKVATMQESTYYYWQDDPIDEQIWYYNLIMEMDLILCHNEPDLKYYKGITDKRCEIMRTLMIEDKIEPHIVNPVNMEEATKVTKQILKEIEKQTKVKYEFLGMDQLQVSEKKGKTQYNVDAFIVERNIFKNTDIVKRVILISSASKNGYTPS